MSAGPSVRAELEQLCAHRREHGAEATTRTVADFADRWTRTSDGWRLTARMITPVFDAPQA
jgi:hypothetical protein